MSIEVYNTATMIAQVASLRRRASFILDTFFQGYVGPNGQEEIFFDVENDSLGVAPFVSPLLPAKLAKEKGYQTKSFAPAYVKEMVALDPRRPLKRMFGEPLLGTADPQARAAAQLAMTLDDLIGRIYRRMELMAVDAIDTGKNTITGDGYDAKIVDYGRASGQTVTLGSSVEWGDSGVSPVDDLDDWLLTVATATGIAPDIVVMDKLAWKLYEADAKYEKRRDSTLRVMMGGTTGDTGVREVEGGVLKAIIDNKVRIYVYNQQYKNAAGSIVNMVPDYTVWIGTSDARAQGSRCFGTIIDADIDYSSAELADPQTGAIIDFAPKTWTEKNPGQRFVLVQASPLTALTRPNATMRVRVKTA